MRALWSALCVHCGTCVCNCRPTNACNQAAGRCISVMELVLKPLFLQLTLQALLPALLKEATFGGQNKLTPTFHVTHASPNKCRRQLLGCSTQPSSKLCAGLSLGSHPLPLLAAHPAIDLAPYGIIHNTQIRAPARDFQCIQAGSSLRRHASFGLESRRVIVFENAESSFGRPFPFPLKAGSQAGVHRSSSYAIPTRIPDLMPHEHSTTANPSNYQNAAGTSVVIQGALRLHIPSVQTFALRPVSANCCPFGSAGSGLPSKIGLEEFPINCSTWTCICAQMPAALSHQHLSKAVFLEVSESTPLPCARPAGCF